MPSSSLESLLSELEHQKTQFSPNSGRRIEQLLRRLAGRSFREVDSLIRFHEALLFLLAHPHDSSTRKLIERLMNSFELRVQELRQSGQDLTPFDYIEYSGIAGTEIRGHFSYDIARWLVSRFGAAVEIAWEMVERKERLGATLPRFLPLLEEDSLVEASVPYREWMLAAKPNRRAELDWLVERFESLDLSAREKAELYDGLELWVRWKLYGSLPSRTRNFRHVRRVFFHKGALIARRDVSLKLEIARPVVAEKLSPRDGLEIIDMLRATTTVRYRELYGITHGDSRSVVRVDAGRGVEIFLWGLPRERRLPIRAYHLGFTLKNGVPVNYIEGLTFCGRMEVGFNTFYTFREGESAWVYAQVLRILHQLVGASCFSIDPYQLGFNNEEAIESGAYWFYRKLGFRSASAELRAVAEREEKKILRRKDYKSSPRILRKLSSGNALYEVDESRRGEWDRFSVRYLGLAVQRMMSRDFDGDKAKLRDAMELKIEEILRIGIRDLSSTERESFKNLALLLGLIPGLKEWSAEEKRRIEEFIRSKMSDDEASYVRLLEEHKRLNDALLRLASSER